MVLVLHESTSLKMVLSDRVNVERSSNLTFRDLIKEGKIKQETI